jgi:prolyl-tRNA synthetase
VVGKGLVDGVVEVKDRASGERDQVPVGDAVAHVVDAVREPVGNPISEG